MGPELNKIFYNTTVAQCVSTCGEYLFAGNNFGDIFVYNILRVCAPPSESSDEPRGHINGPNIPNKPTRPQQILKVTDDDQLIHSLAFHSNFLIVGMSGVVIGFTWFKNRLTKKAWEIRLPSALDTSSQQNDVNCLWMNKIEGILYAGCGDNNIHALTLDGGQVVRSFSGHTDYIHWIDGDNERKLYSASEDGSVKCWDQRDKKVVQQLEPFKNDSLARPQFGKWQSTVAVTDDWLVCGGGPRVSLWHLRSLECTTIFPFAASARVAGFLDDVIYAGGDCDSFCQYNLKGDVTAEIPVSSISVYSVVARAEPEKFLSIAGASNSLDICTNYNYRDIVLNLYESPVKRIE